MIEGRTILCSASGYDAPPTSKHHVMHHLAERNVVLWVNYHMATLKLILKRCFEKPSVKGVT